MHDANKSGMVTGTTTGDILVEMGKLPVDICMPDFLGCTPSYHLLLRKVTEVSAASEKGDSGAPVFTGNPNQGAPYAAMGILVASGCCSYVFARWDLIESRLGLGTLNPQTTIP
jgi:hypothetical protein